MLNQDQLDFFTRWLDKADAIRDEEVGSLIDKYVTLFINYNFLYNTLPLKISLRDGTPRKDVGDKEGSTKLVLRFVGAQAVADYLTQEGLEPEIDQVARVIENRIFNIKLKNGTPQPETDALLAASLRTTDPDTKTLALLEILYYVRCNIVHGEKALHQYQEMLLMPCIQLLRAIIVLVSRDVQRMAE